MTPFFAELKRAREQRKMSLADIAGTTLINVRFLEAIEKGDTSILPEVYVRAFLREYAAAVGLDPADTLRQFDAERAPAPTHRVPVPAGPPPPAPEAGPAAPSALEALLASPAALRLAGTAVGIVALLVLIWNLLGSGAGNDVREIPFRSVVSEHEQRLAASPAESPRAAPADSLVLRASVADTVWMTVAADSSAPREYIFRPGARAAWKARDRFTVTLGNGGAVQFTLNDRQLGVLGKRGSVLRNVLLSRATLSGK
jgi:cytoskeleton protein RodZ